jgi:hypothetical protein
MKKLSVPENKNIYNLSLHEMTITHLLCDFIKVLRVPGGWIYYYTSDIGTFVPFDNEFQERSKYDSDCGH